MQRVKYLFYTSNKCHTHRRFLVNGFDDKLFVIERDVSNLTPGKADLWCQPEKIRGEQFTLLTYQPMTCDIQNKGFHAAGCRKFSNIQPADGAEYEPLTGNQEISV